MTAGTASMPIAVSAESGKHGATRFRTDIQGLRAVAVGVVLAHHAGVPGFGGGYVGVDVFFVISGFLITGLLVREVESTGRLALVRFYARRARRLLPAAGLAMLGTAIMTLVVLPATRWGDIVGDLLASSFYVVNWRLAERSVDYLGAEQAASPLQHFWSLAVEEQFYVVWPLLMVLLLWVHRRWRLRLRTTLFAGLLVVSVLSLAWSVWMTAAEPGRAYFVTTTRLWELAIGGLLVFAVPWLTRWSRGKLTLLGWAGLAAIVVATTLYTASTPFPGAAAMLPTLGAAAILAAGVLHPERGVGRVLGLSFMQDVGAASYSLYLWHWPVLVAATALWGSGGTLWLPTAILAVGASMVPAWFAYRAVERPVHQSRWLAKRTGVALVLGLVCMLVGVGSAAAVHAAVDSTRTAVGADVSVPGARALGDEPMTSPAGAVGAWEGDRPDPVAAVDDITDPAFDGCNQGIEGTGLLDCVAGDPDGDVTVALVGDSHAWHWLPALASVAESRGWRLELHTKSSCGFFDGASSADDPPVRNTSCTEYDRALMERLLGPERPDAVIAAGSNRYRLYDDAGAVLSVEGSSGALIQAYATQWAQVVSAGIEMLVIRNTPWMAVDVPDCLAQHPDATSECAGDRATAMRRAGDAELVASESVPEVHLVDVNDWICPRDRCAPIIGGAIVFRDSHHLTATYARTLAPVLDAALSATGVFDGEPRS